MGTKRGEGTPVTVPPGISYRHRSLAGFLTKATQTAYRVSTTATEPNERYNLYTAQYRSVVYRAVRQTVVSPQSTTDHPPGSRILNKMQCYLLTRHKYKRNLQVT